MPLFIDRGKAEIKILLCSQLSYENGHNSSTVRNILNIFFHEDWRRWACQVPFYIGREQKMRKYETSNWS